MAAFVAAYGARVGLGVSELTEAHVRKRGLGEVKVSPDVEPERVVPFLVADLVQGFVPVSFPEPR